MDGLEASSAFTRKPSALVAVWTQAGALSRSTPRGFSSFLRMTRSHSALGSSLALESLPGESCHTDKVALARKVLTRGLACLIHCVAARQHGDDTAEAHGGHGPLDHVVVERHSVDFNSVGVGDVAYGGVK